ncbi:MAG: endonuclease/exonuclease/phosphatase family protein [Puniceicoccales bacterium]|jgi:endonuclease/exonuclease/phosphatase family metal-dependent hydrolase|nr:endonuclease/exonuclease/phosphatase family protein [Puniceicoccales bacterium]
MKKLLTTLFIAMAGMAASSAADTEFTIVSYNIHAGVGMDKKINLPRIADTLRKQNADIIVLQEVDNKTGRSGKVDQAAELAKLLDMKFYFAQAMPYGGGGYGNAILSKFPLEKPRTLELVGGKEPRSAGMAEIVKNGRRVAVIGVHLDLQTSTHPEHVKLITEEAKKQASATTPIPVFFGGDFNAKEKSPIWKQLSKDWEQPKKQGPKNTFPSTGPKEEIDWFLYMPSSMISLKEYKVIEEPMASDHCPIVLKVTVTENKK